MPDLTIWHGSVKVFPVETPKKVENGAAVPYNNFETCVHRSAEIESHVIKTCCSQVTKRGHRCNKLQIFPLTANACINCSEYVPKEKTAA